MSNINLNKPLEPQVRHELVLLGLKHLRLDLKADRQQRIEDTMREYMDKGASATHAFSAALEYELLLYGDPNVNKGSLPIGILNCPATESTK